MAIANFSIDEMHCGKCVQRVSDVLRGMPRVSLRNVAIGSAEVEYDPAAASLQAMAEALTKAGFPARSGASSIAIAAATTDGKSSKDGGCGRH